MFYEWHKDVPKNTTETAKLCTEVEPGGEILTRIQIAFPRGCAGLARAQLYQGGFQVFPGNLQGHIRGDAVEVDASLRYDMRQNAGPWYWYTWNTDDTYQHTLTLRMETFEEGQLLLRLDPASWLNVFRRLFGRFKGG